MRSENNQTGVPGPAQRIERCVILGEVGVSAVAEDPFDEVEVGHHGARDDKARLHPPFPGPTRHTDDDQRPEQKGDEARGRRSLD